MGIVGESGCGKSTLARTLLRLIEPTKGKVEYMGKSVLDMNNKDLRSIRKNTNCFFKIPIAHSILG